MGMRLKALILSMVLLLGVAGTAFAETKVSINGTYRIRAFYLNNYKNVADKSEDEDKSSFFDQRFRINVKLFPSDNLVLECHLQALRDNKWGTQTGTLTWKYKPGMPGWPGWPSSSPGAGDFEYNSGIEFYRVWMTIMTQYGVFFAGRSYEDGAGLSMFGDAYGVSPVEADRLVFDSRFSLDRARYYFKKGAFSMWAFYEKTFEVDCGDIAYAAGEQDKDFDKFGILPQWNFGPGSGVNCLIRYDRNHSGVEATPALPNWGVGLSEKSEKWIINPSLRIKRDTWEFNTELKYITGEMKGWGWVPGNDKDLEGLGFYMDGIYKYGSGLVGAWYLYTQGDDDATDDKMKGMVGSGFDYVPLFIAYDTAMGAFSLNDAANHQALGVWVDHNITENLVFHAAYGYIDMSEVPDGVGKHYGSEFDMALKYTIMKNLDYTLAFGYLAPGDYFKDMLGHETGNVYMFKNQIVMSF